MTAIDQPTLDQPDTTPDDDQEFWDWHQIGLDRGWVSAPACETHDGTPLTPEEIDEFEDGADPCIHVLRLWPDGPPAV